MSLLRTMAVSDLHTDCKENMEWVKQALETPTESVFSVLIVAGDLSDRTEILLETFRLLSARFDLVLFTPGNHDVWVTESESLESSLEKHRRVRSLLETLPNVFCRPVSVSIRAVNAPDIDITPSWKVAYVPILGWHSEIFDWEAEIPESEINGKKFPSINKVVSDRSKAKFKIPELLEEKQASPIDTDQTLREDYNALLSAFNMFPSPQNQIENWDSAIIAWKMDLLNLEPLKAKDFILKESAGYEMVASDISANVLGLFRGSSTRQEVLGPGYDKVVSFSHFLPFPFLNPEKRFLFYPPLAKVVGSIELGLRMLQIVPDIHIFGHTHFGWNATVGQLLEGQGVEPQKQNSCLRQQLLDCRFVQAPLGYPRERQMRLRSMMVGNFNSHMHDRNFASCLILDTNSTFTVNEGFAYWSDYYRRHRRDGSNTKVADYVRDIYSGAALG
eukprot:Gregarina_sp_Poly_1__199@NODE_1046_length_5256_cov_159_119676_g726_i0_p2_GENE_NODE_1046_length_5256_cov_159_119676_g726_i0NODE_1046_length_5256_cov_159_119676_g726_i0_p2_ORF_typecomplete_len446_score63_57Metallophos/PF00149_28/8_3e09Metallophos_2/PF12850_7/1e06Metallophos_2/PF12850_7/18DNA_pol_E_B/PF04042_16/0_072_NODE_1046_length_5256_cov_159_119676_g726_i032504587